MNTRDIGNITTLKVITKFSELGYNILIPFGDNTKYDFVVEKENKFTKIQCKTSRLSRNKKSINFNTSVAATNCSGSRIKHYSENDVDYFATVWNNVVYVIPAKLVLTHRRTFTLVFEKDKDNFAGRFILDQK